MMKKHILAAIIISVILPFQTWAESPEDKGNAIVREAEKRESGFGDVTAEMIMILKDRHGNESKRIIRSKTLEVPGDGDKGLSIFDNPRDVKGTAMLTFSHKIGDDDQWLYLPALKRVKRISSSNKSASFMGSEFAYEDIGSQEPEKYFSKWLRDEIYEGEDCFVIEQRPSYKRSGYTKQIVWLDKSEYRAQKVDYYDRKNLLFKTLTFHKYNKYIDKLWRPGEMHMINHQTGKSTKLYWNNYKFKTGLTDRDFNKNSLKKVR